MSAANWNAISRCAPTVVPVFPPTGVAGVESLKPTPGALPLTIVIVAAIAFGALAKPTARARETAKARRPTARRRKDLLLLELRARRCERKHHAGAGRETPDRDRAVGISLHHDSTPERFLEIDGNRSVGTADLDERRENALPLGKPGFLS